MGTNIELYEALKPHVGDDGARLIAEVVPATEDLATKADMADLRHEFVDFRQQMMVDFGELRREFAEFRADMYELKAEMRGWMLKFFVPLWIGVYGTLGAVVISIVVRS